jgi:hypothetical protein
MTPLADIADPNRLTRAFSMALNVLRLWQSGHDPRPVPHTSRW